MFKKIFAILFAVITAFSSLTICASAKNVCDTISGCSGKSGGNTTTFYADAGNTKKHYIKVNETKGTLTSDGALTTCGNKKLYDYLNVKVYGQGKSGNWKLLSDTNYKNKSSFKITFSGYKSYKFVVHSWCCQTIEETEVFWPNLQGRAYKAGSANWLSQPTWQVSKTSGMTDCSALYT